MATSIRFRISAPAPGTHLFHIEATVHGVGELATTNFHLPAWTPGSYLVREYAQHVQRFTARGDDGRPRKVRKASKACWTVDCRDTNSIELSYDVFAHDLGVRNNHLDSSHGFVTPSATFVYPEERLSESVSVEVAPPDGWRVFTGLEATADDIFVASDFDELFDSPIEMGPHESFAFEAVEKPHDFVWWGRGNYDQERLARDLPKIVDANAEIFGGGLPYERYLTICLLTDNQYGGLEHKNSTALMFPRHGFRDAEGSLDAPITDAKYRDFLTLFAHEHFHAWHVKRIRPERLGPFNYQGENYTRDIWTIEGITSYYQDVSLLRAGLIDARIFLEELAQAIHRMETNPGRHLHSLEESSFDAWIKLYRPHENNLNSTVSYYLKGKIIAALLDVYLRSETEGASSLDDVMRELWRAHSHEVGYPEGGLESIITETTGVDVKEFFDLHVRGTNDPDYGDYFEAMGLELDREPGKASDAPWLGAALKEESGGVLVRSVRADGPAYGILNVGDRIVAVNHWEANEKILEALLRDAGSEAELHVFRLGELIGVRVPVGKKPSAKYEIRIRENVADEVLTLLEGWVGARELRSEES